MLLAAAVTAPQTPWPLPMNTIAERYVKLVLALGQHDADYVDAFYGPPEWKADAERQKTPLGEVGAAADRLSAEFPRLSDADRRDELVVLRRDYLERQLAALRARVRMLEGAPRPGSGQARLTFDEESQALYDAVAPVHRESYFEGTRKEIEQGLPGQGALVDRWEAFRRNFIVSSDKLGRVFDRAIAECRTRTLPHVQLPATETFTVEYVKNKPWSGYNLGKDLVKQYVESRGGVASQPARRWQEFVRLLASPRLPSGLRAQP